MDSDVLGYTVVHVGLGYPWILFTFACLMPCRLIFKDLSSLLLWTGDFLVTWTRLDLDYARIFKNLMLFSDHRALTHLVLVQH